MDFYDTLDQVVALLQQRGRVTYRTLKREFQLNDEGIDDLKDERLFSYPEISEVDERGQQEEGISHMRYGIAAFHAAGAEIERPYMLALLGEVYAKMGEQEQGRKAPAEARAIVDKTGERCWEAELAWLEGELTLLSTRPSQELSFPEAESSFHKALEVARRQEAKSLELRAATSLARLWQSRGKQAEARDLLAPVYDWFTEGFDTKDLQEAKALLQKLKGE